MPDNIIFNTIPTDIRTPGQFLEIDNSKALRGLPSLDRRILVMGNMLATGTASAETLYRINSGDEGAALFGRGSVLHEMLRLVRAANKTSDVWALGLEDLAAGVAATKVITVSGPATAAGTIALYINGQKLSIGVAAGDTPSTVATAIAAVVGAYANGPVTAAAVDDVVTLTARHKGAFTQGIAVLTNFYDDEVLPAGITVAIADGVTGAGNPDAADALAAISDESFYTIISPWSDAANMALVEAELGSRFGGMDMRTGHVFVGVAGTHGTLTTYGSARNNAHSTFIGVKGAPQAPYLWGAVLGAVAEFNGAIDPARPLQTLVLPGLLAPRPADRFRREERDLLLRDGCSTFTVAQDGTVLIERVVTTYQTNAWGIEDVSYLDLESVWTADYMRYAFRVAVATDYPRHKLADDGTDFDPAQPIATPSMIKGTLVATGKKLEKAGLLEGFEEFKTALVVQRSMVDRNRVNAVIPPDLVNQFRIFAGSIQFIL
ncbi:tail sheath protein [Bordetella ansorpii]|uniref:Tail sheath protein n=1 Tax=Bordetella ansorpii TaxID=288768 RepID=A0A157SVS6_9BORD|nr:phage tail sheath subtilisin-like domain-containing protein [Bordetella ansorpii]SAI74568.1 tail sheath protein [Bordetella ansorpii]